MKGDHNQPLPPELDWENMKEGIFDKIQSIEQQEASQRDKSHSRRRIGLFLIFLYVLILGVFFISRKIITAPDPEAQGIIQLPESDTNKSASNDINKFNHSHQIEFSGEPLGEYNQDQLGTAALPTYQDSVANQVSKKTANPRIDIDPLATYAQGHKLAPLNRPQNTGQTAATQAMLHAASNSSSSSVANRPTKFRPHIPALQALPTHRFGPISLETIAHPIGDIPRRDSVSHPVIPPQKTTHQLILEGGVTFWQAGYGDTQPERARYEVPLTSFHLQGHYMRRVNRTYFIMAGLQYQQLESRLDYSNIIPDYKVILRDTIVKVQNNLISGEKSSIRGDVEQFVQAERRVRHHNTSKLFKVSIGLGKSWRFKSFQTDVYLGGALNSWTHHQGRTLFNDMIIDFNGASNSLFQNQMTAEGMLGARVHYHLTPSLGLTTGFQAQKSLMNWSNQEMMLQYPASFSLQMGLSYSL